MPEQDTVIAVYKLHDDAEAALKTLRELGFDAAGVSIAGRNFHTVESPVGYYTTGGQVKPCGQLGPFWSELLPYFSEFALLWVPDLGPLVVTGRLAPRVIQTSEDNATAYGLTAFGAALHSLGVPEDSVLACEDAVEHDHFVLMLQAGEDDAKRAQVALAASDAEWMEVYHSSLHTAV